MLPTFLDDDRPVARWALLTAAVVIVIGYALTWSPFWYPLADSGLYLGLGRSLADGDGMRYMGLPYKRITPLTPALIAVVFKAGGGVGAVHAVMIGLLLIANLFCFLTLRNWFNERVAFLATIVAASQFWIWRNAIFIMTEPAFLAGFWTGMYCLSLVPKIKRPGMRWVAVFVACACAAFAYESRAIPTLILLACALPALWITTRKTIPWVQRSSWVLLFVAVFGFLLYEFGKPVDGGEETVAQEIKVDTARGDRTKAVMRLTDRYNVKAFQNVKGPWWQKTLYAPVLAGRWINEGFVSPMVFFFGSVKAKSGGTIKFAIGCVFALAALTFCIVGWWTLLMRGHWWPVLLAGYAAPFFANWFGRVLPRYYVPIAPILFIILCVGVTVTMGWAVRKWRKERESDYRRWALAAPALLAFLIVLGNLPVYAIELYVRHAPNKDFYHYARQGAIAELIDIGGYLQKNSDPKAIVYVNTGGFSQRVGYFLSGRRIEMPVDTRKTQVAVKKADDAAQIFNFLQKVPAEARHAIVFSTQYEWPDWHWPLKGPRNRSWWQLYERDYDTGEFRRVELKPDRDYLVRGVPQSGLKGTGAQVEKQAEAEGITVTDSNAEPNAEKKQDE